MEVGGVQGNTTKTGWEGVNNSKECQSSKGVVWMQNFYDKEEGRIPKTASADTRR
jgi:hypothetical protein